MPEVSEGEEFGVNPLQKPLGYLDACPFGQIDDDIPDIAACGIGDDKAVWG
jgi:hypothetical protein